MVANLNLLPGEHVVLSSDDDALVLTNLRVRHSQEVWGQQEMVSITLDAVSSVGLVASSNPVLLVLAGVAGLAGLTAGGDMAAVLLIVSGLLVAAYFATRRKAISVKSNGGHGIVAAATGLDNESCMKFIDGVERAKLQKMNA